MPKRHSISVCITCISHIVRCLSLMYVIQETDGAHYEHHALDLAFHPRTRLPSVPIIFKRVKGSSLSFSRQHLRRPFLRGYVSRSGGGDYRFPGRLLSEPFPVRSPAASLSSSATKNLVEGCRDNCCGHLSQYHHRCP